ncbi:hypothetical protein [Deinococcus hopiensis]|uniref:Uncharacterized protein n=1 Tax=Deinococcus hopiensis KR-140 TaxID=695939 RepID=A0A1W1UX83_9DEIO|nr:hypothetical protein [Deinococcus hopiensis]SMB85656.1 hypothetical protein SAMN00790413_03494 [Deinococcus hopiensis KR-140]
MTGRLLKVGKGILLAEHVAVVHAPVPEKWQEWKPKRWTLSKPAKKPLSQEESLERVTI